MLGICYRGQMTLVGLFIPITKGLKIVEMSNMLLKEKNNKTQKLTL